ncbi:MAG: PQQ-binding-like beta-propeller repeat protein [Planctomycetales bacterium]|nr:PQQ-binding-like beta-propeller repeat protein [Planctomycetales bacterium]
MEAKGALSPESLHDVFQKLAKNKAIGTLIVSQGENRKYIYFARAGVRLLSSGKQRRMRLGDILVQQGKISADQLKAILQRQEETGEMIGKILTDWGLVTEEDIDEAVKGQIEEEIYDLFTWEEATYEFTEGAPPAELFDPDQRATRLTFDVHRLVSEAGNRAAELRELRRVIPTERAVFAPSPGAPREIADRDATAAVRAVAGLVDGRRTAGEIAEAAQISRFDAFRALAALALAGRIRASDGSGRAGPAGAPRADGKGAVSKMESRLLAAPDDHELRRKLAAAYEEAGEKAKAALHWSLAAKSLQKEGQLEEALDATRQGLELAPDDLDAAERMLRLTVELRRPEEAMGQAEALASRYSDAGDREKLRNMYALLLHIVPEDLEVRKKLVNVHLDLEDMDAALEEYVEMAKVLAKRKDQKALEEIYGKVLRLAPNRADVQRRLRSLGVGGAVAAARRSSVRWRRKLGIVFLLLALLGAAAGAISLEVRARSDAAIPWEAALVAERVAAEAKDPQNALGRAKEALAALEGIERRHPWSLFTLLEVAPKIAEAKARISELQGAVAERDREARARINVRREEALRLEADGHHDEAMSIWEELMRLPPRETEQLKEILREAKERTERRSRKRGEADALWREAQAQAMAGQLADARKAVERLRGEEFRGTDAQSASRWPVRLETRPPEAEVRRGGELLGKTPVLVWLTREEEKDGVPLDFEISRTGYEPRALRIVASDAREGVLSIPLEKRPLFRIPAGGAVESGPVVEGGWLAVGSRNGKGEVLGVRLADVNPDDPATWRPGWQYDIQGDIDTSVIGPVLEDGGTLYAATRSGLLLALAMRPEAAGGSVIARGELLWSFPAGSGRIGTVYGGPVVAGDAIAVAGYSGTQGVLVLLARGSRDGGRPLRSVEVGPSESSPLAAGNLIVVADRAGGVQVWHRLREQVVARGQLPARAKTSGSPAADGDALVVGGKDGKVYLLDFADPEGERGPTLKLLDEADLGEAIAPSPVAREGIFYAASRKGLVAAFRVKDRRLEERWRRDVREPVTVGPVLSQNVLFVGTERGGLVCLNAFTGEEEWRFEVPRDSRRPGPVAINSRPAVSNGVVYFGCDDGYLYALAER